MTSIGSVALDSTATPSRSASAAATLAAPANALDEASSGFVQPSTIATGAYGWLPRPTLTGGCGIGLPPRVVPRLGLDAGHSTVVARALGHRLRSRNRQRDARVLGRVLHVVDSRTQSPHRFSLLTHRAVRRPTRRGSPR